MIQRHWLGRIPAPKKRHFSDGLFRSRSRLRRRARKSRPTSTKARLAPKLLRSADEPGGYRRDLPIRHGRVLIGDLDDTRNLDNLVLRQLHVLFLKFHNEASGNWSPIRRWRKGQRLHQWHPVRASAPSGPLALPMDDPPRFSAAHRASERVGPSDAQDPPQPGRAFPFPSNFPWPPSVLDTAWCGMPTG